MGSVSVATDDLRLGAFGLTPNQQVVFLQGSAAAAGGNGVPFGDGRLCASTRILRLQSVNANLFGGAESSVPLAAQGGVAPGDTRYYQLWFRTGASSTCGSGFNLTNALKIAWQP